ncbi:MAG: glycosyltransferase [Bryobacterales bacterium]|nr:glycosyltransferase [Bryobacterales bacterium]
MPADQRLTVLNVAYPLAPVGRNAAGGAEQVLSAIDRYLVARGHTSIVIARESSDSAGILETVPAVEGELTEAEKRGACSRHRNAIARVLRNTRIDIVHMHGVDAWQYLPETRAPVLITLHLPLFWYTPEIFTAGGPNVWLNCVSRAQHVTAPSCSRMLDPVPNGVEIQPKPGHKRLFCAALGRICPEKGFHHAISAARKAGAPLLLAGQVFAYPEHVAYFQNEIQPLLDSRRRFIGTAGFSAKRNLLSRAQCLLIPSLIAETSSLVAMEGMMCGAPVVAFHCGALPEIVEHGKTGFLVANEDEMAEAIHRASDLNSDRIRCAALSRFSAAAMCESYLEIYRRLVQRGCATAG